MNDWKSKIKRKGLGIAPQEVSDNLQAPELAPKDKRFTGRTKQLGLSVKPEFAKRLKMIAAEEDCFVIEVLEKALECYEKHRKEESQHYQPRDKELESKISPKIKQKPVQKPTQAQLNPHSHQDFTCDNCQKKFHNETAYSPTRGSSFLAETYCANCVETEGEEFCSFIDMINKKICLNPLFDKKKQLCRSHNRQVRNRFNEFIKDKSIASSGAWEMSWEQSGDWRYFWNLAQEKEKHEK